MKNARRYRAENIGLFTCSEHKKYIENNLLFDIAPILVEAKPAALISFNYCCRAIWEEQGERIVETTGLSAIELYENPKTFSVLIYSEKALEIKLQSIAARTMLKSFGYSETADSFEQLMRLKGRFSGNEFPHEIGIFLGYPPNDVAAFIEKKGKDYLCCSYWKVYHNEQTARETFQSIDEVKARAVSLIKQQIPFSKAAAMLTNT